MVTYQQAGQQYFEAARQRIDFLDLTSADQARLDSFHRALLQLVHVADEKAQLDPGLYGSEKTRWVPAAQAILNQCAHIEPAMRGLERTLLFSAQNCEDQQLLFSEMKQEYPQKEPATYAE